MKIPMHYSLEVAHQVVNKIDIPKSIAEQVTVESWSNCREQGLCISVTIGGYANWKRICVAQHRSSDSILVISGPHKEFDDHNQPSEEVWRNGVHFHFNEQKKAAEFIKKEIEKAIELK